jgi:hypothetical protein
VLVSSLSRGRGSRTVFWRDLYLVKSLH